MSDAWQQMHELLERYSKEWEVRRDLKVIAEACDRQVRLGVPNRGKGKFDRPSVVWLDPRNVGTMREFATAIVEACDFVDAANPVWASHVEEAE